jgi:hypothetical protein
MRISDEVEFLSIYFIMGDSPQGWTRNAIKDPPAGGWSNAYVIHKSGFLPKIFVPYTLQSWPVPKECYELERTREPLKVPEPVWVQDQLIRSFNSRQKLGVPMDLEAAGDVCKALGFEVPVEFKPADAEPVPAKERKAKERAAKPDSRAGLVTVASIALELGIVPRIARGYLRDLKVPKPEVGWAGDQAWADDIKAKLQAEMNKEKKAKPAPKAKPEPEKKVKVKKVAPKPVKKAPAPAPKVSARKPVPKKAPAKKASVKKTAPKKKARAR